MTYRKKSISSALLKIVIIVSFVLSGANAIAQCSITGINQQGCGGPVTLNASTNGSVIKNHIWYEPDGVTVITSGITQNVIDYNGDGLQDAWASHLSRSISATTTFYVKADCAGSNKPSVTYTIQAGDPVFISMTPALGMPDNLCAGETITLKAENAKPNDYQWRFNNQNDPNFTGDITKTATQTGTYYLTARNSCNELQYRSIYLNFKPVMSGIAITPQFNEICQGAAPTAFSPAGYNYDFVTWSMTDNDPAVNAEIGPTTGLVDWKNMTGTATISMTATGCHSTTAPAAPRTIIVTPKPTLAQCAMSVGGQTDYTGCSIDKLSATSYSAFVTSHKWYKTQTGTELVPINVGPTPNGGGILTTFTGDLSQSTTYWAEPQCTCGVVGTRVAVKFTKDPGSAIGIVMTPTSNPGDLCVGETIKLQGSGGSSYEWRLNDQNKITPDFQGPEINVSYLYATTATYYVRGVNSCGGSPIPGGSIQLKFKATPSSVALIGPSSFCQNDAPVQFSAGGSDYTPQWSISDTDPTLNAAINPTSGMVTWNGISTDAVITMAVKGCHNTTFPALAKTKIVTVNRTPYNLSITTTQNPFCMGSVPFTSFLGSGNSATGFIAWQVSGAGNSIDQSGKVTWGTGFSGEATISALATGCNNSQIPVSKKFSVFSNPTATISPSGSVSIPFRAPFIKLTSGLNQSYQWLNGSSLIDGASAIDFNAGEEGSYSVKVTDGNGCTGISSPVTVTKAGNYNYLVETVLLSDKKSDNSEIKSSDIWSLPSDKKQEMIQFIDGLGRPMQTRSHQASAVSKTDIVQPIIYDAYGREKIRYLPFASDKSNGEFEPEALTAQVNFYNTAEGIAHDKPYAETIYESSPLNRVIKQGAAGEAWQPDSQNTSSSTDHTIKKEYKYNQESDYIYRFTYNSNSGEIGMNSPADRYYGVNQLYANITWDENHHQTIEFTDKQGQVVCKKIQSDKTNGFACTYYIYDDFGNLAVVLPPQAVEEIIKAQ